ncbi:hypothetical protein BGX23_000600 [Mortierella sp. AD031]|nr:hypothetical protein BGX23_000600 [Mortierella sp. AD031]
MGRPRSNSVSSAGTSRSSGSSHSSSTVSRAGGAGGEGGGGRVKQPGPPPSFMNKVLVGNYRSNHKKMHHQHHTLRKVGSIGSFTNNHCNGYGSSNNALKVLDDLSSKIANKSNSSLNSKKFPSHGDLTKYSWDYRKEMPID